MRLEYVLKDQKMKRTARADRRLWIEKIGSEAEQSAEDTKDRSFFPLSADCLASFFLSKKLAGVHPTRCRQHDCGASHHPENQSAIDRALREEQAGARKGRNTVEQIFILRNIREQVNLYTHFVDFERPSTQGTDKDYGPL